MTVAMPLDTPITLPKSRIDELISICNQADTLWRLRTREAEGAIDLKSRKYTVAECDQFIQIIQDVTDELIEAIEGV